MFMRTLADVEQPGRPLIAPTQSIVAQKSLERIALLRVVGCFATKDNGTAHLPALIESRLIKARPVTRNQHGFGLELSQRFAEASARHLFKRARAALRRMRQEHRFISRQEIGVPLES